MSSNVTVIDYGSGNLHSVIKALREAGADVLVTQNPEEVSAARRLVLPGVGSFEDGMKGLQSRDMADAVREYCCSQRPFLGICLGMQMLLTGSTEFGHHEGLGIIPGRVVGIPRQPGFKVPHIGWSEIHPPSEDRWCQTIFEGIEPGARFYFVHSFSAVPSQEHDRLADTDYGGFRVSAAVNHGHVYGCQFHPEKSGEAGIGILRRFLMI